MSLPLESKQAHDSVAASLKKPCFPQASHWEREQERASLGAAALRVPRRNSVASFVM